MKKIILVTRPISPPWDEASKNFAYYLAKNVPGFEFHIMGCGADLDVPKNVIQESVYTSADFDLYQKIRSLKYQFNARRKFDIAHYFFTPAKLNSFLIRNFIQIPKTKSIQTIATLREDIFSDEEIKSLMFSDILVTYSNHAKEKLNSLGFTNVERIYPGIDLDYYSPASKDSALMKHWDIAERDFVISYPGEYVRLGATDDIADMLIENAQGLRENNIKFIFACRVKNSQDAKKKQYIMERLEINNILDHVIFTDTFKDMAKLYNLSDIVIFPVRDMKGKFDVPLAAIEPMACEKPIIISGLPILQEFANNQNAVTIEAGNINQLWQAIMDLKSNKDKRTNMGIFGRKFAERFFDIKNIARKYAEIYEKL